GYKRVILSREAKLEDICLIKENTDIEIENFVQGAICVAFSGNCYLSSIKDGNSGNRGRCHQLCRLKYECGKKSGYLLSPADLCLADQAENLIKAGVTSFKIEGRAKRPAYVAAAVKTYRDVLDGKDKKAVYKSVNDLTRTFSRGEYDKAAYLYGNDGIIDVVNNNNTGVFIGVVTAVRPFKDLIRVTVKAENAVIRAGDGLRLVGEAETTIGVGAVTEEVGGAFTVITARKGIRVGDKVFKTLDAALEQDLLSDRKTLTVDCAVKALAGRPVKIRLSCGDTSVTVEGETAKTAINSPIDRLFVINQMKFGEPYFALGDVTLETDGVFIAKSQFNDLRRKAVKALTAAIIGQNTPKLSDISPTGSDYRQAIQYYTDFCDRFDGRDEYVMLESLSLVSADERRAVVYSPKDYNILEKPTIIDLSAGLYLDLPIIATQKDIAVIEKLLDRLDKAFGRRVGVVANNYYGLKYLGHRPVVAGYGLNVYNRVTAGALLSLGVKDIIASGEIGSLLPFVAYKANLPLMTFAHCPYKVVAGSTCDDCKASAPLVYRDERGNEYRITRYKVFYCSFRLRLNNNKEYTKLVQKDKAARGLF
ncbi:MAG: U32 family peptidase, partial [Clostridia bacterium]|nr:U32 family peptidase [Clostridia bacterium]